MQKETRLVSFLSYQGLISMTQDSIVGIHLQVISRVLNASADVSQLPSEQRTRG